MKDIDGENEITWEKLKERDKSRGWRRWVGASPQEEVRPEM